MRFCFPVLRNAGYAKEEERAARKVGEGRGRGAEREERRRGTRRKKKQKKRGTHPRGRPNGRAGHCTRLRECNSLQLHCERRAKTSTTAVCTGAMPYLGVTLPAALTCILAIHADARPLFSSLLVLRPLSPSSPWTLSRRAPLRARSDSPAIIVYEDVRGRTWLFELLMSRINNRFNRKID